MGEVKKREEKMILMVEIIIQMFEKTDIIKQ